MKYKESKVFTCVCHSVNGGGTLLDAPPASGCTPHQWMHSLPAVTASPFLPVDASPLPPEDRWSTGGPYASYWNMYLFKFIFFNF